MKTERDIKNTIQVINIFLSREIIRKLNPALFKTIEDKYERLFEFIAEANTINSFEKTSYKEVSMGIIENHRSLTVADMQEIVRVLMVKECLRSENAIVQNKLKDKFDLIVDEIFPDKKNLSKTLDDQWGSGYKDIVKNLKDNPEISLGELKESLLGNSFDLKCENHGFEINM